MSFRFSIVSRLIILLPILYTSCDQPQQSSDRSQAQFDLSLDTNMLEEDMNLSQDSTLDLPDMMISISADASVLIDMAVNLSPVATCDVALGGEPWDNMVVESPLGIEAELMSISLDQLPQEIDISSLPSLFAGLIAYMLDIPIESLGGSLQKEVILSKGMLGRVVAASLALGLNTPLGVDYLFLRRGLHRYYHCDKDFPLTLDGFKNNIFDYSTTNFTEHDSIAKCGPRRILSHPELGVYVAETLVDGMVRETEILLEGRRNDGNLDFIIYNSLGQLSDRTRFPTVRAGSEVMASSPYVCTSCHLNSDQEMNTTRFDLLFPEVGPCR